MSSYLPESPLPVPQNREPDGRAPKARLASASVARQAATQSATAAPTTLAEARLRAKDGERIGLESASHGAPNSTAPAPDVIRIRKYPNRRLYDTSRSRHLTHDGVLAIIADGHSVHVSDSRTGTDITNIVLLQILLERDPHRLQALPTALVHRAMRSDVATLRMLTERALVSWLRDDHADGVRSNGSIATTNHGSTDSTGAPADGRVARSPVPANQASAARSTTAPSLAVSANASPSATDRPRAKAKPRTPSA
ncbi:MAG: polyhydroxyalkanoate synthesis regulator DNA-binding domain-containing protein [Phycisphaerales bacterium]